MRERSGFSVVSHALKSENFGDFRVVMPDDWANTHGIVMVWGDGFQDNPLVRIHSRCTYGDVFGSLHCDCREQLELSISLIRQEGRGILFYLEQEGRGAGHLAKAKAYAALEREQLDTFSYYERELGSADFREYGHVSALLSQLGITSIRLLTDNDEKVQCLRDSGILTTKISLGVKGSPIAQEYLIAKHARRAKGV